MKILVLSLVAMFSMNTFALTNEQVQKIVTKAISLEEPTSDLKVVKVQSSLNPLAGLGQIYDGIFAFDRDYEFKNVTFEFSSVEYGKIISKCQVLVSVSKAKYAFVELAECQSTNDVFGQFPRNIDIESMNVSELL